MTWCKDCERWVGVQRGQSARQLSFHRENKIVRHMYKDTMRVCARSGDTLPEALVMDR